MRLKHEHLMRHEAKSGKIFCPPNYRNDEEQISVFNH